MSEKYIKPIAPASYRMLADPPFALAYTHEKLNKVRFTIDSSRIMIRYAEDGGADKDGTIEIRPNVEDLSLGISIYHQCQINVDDKLYLKGIAIYSDTVPDGYDVVFNTDKTKDVPFEEVLKTFEKEE